MTSRLRARVSNTKRTKSSFWTETGSPKQCRCARKNRFRWQSWLGWPHCYPRSPMSDRTLFTSESVTEGHPDKVADQVSDAVLDAILAQDPMARGVFGPLLTPGLCVVAGEISTSAYVDINHLARETIIGIGYDDGAMGFDGRSCGILVSLDKQSPDIAEGVDVAFEQRSGAGNEDVLNAQGAGDQGMMFGYACSDNDDFMPLPIWLAHRLSMRLARGGRSGRVPHLPPAGKPQVTIVYDDGKPVAIDTVLISTQHEDGIDS